MNKRLKIFFPLFHLGFFPMQKIHSLNKSKLLTGDGQFFVGSVHRYTHKNKFPVGS
jgi:hypothetical protein